MFHSGCNKRPWQRLSRFQDDKKKKKKKEAGEGLMRKRKKMTKLEKEEQKRSLVLTLVWRLVSKEEREEGD